MDAILGYLTSAWDWIVNFFQGIIDTVMGFFA